MGISLVIHKKRIIRRENGEIQGIWFGRSAETGIWRSKTTKRRYLWNNHDSLFIAFGKWRLRIMKPSAFR